MYRLIALRLTLALSLIAPLGSVAVAQNGIRDAGAKIRGEMGPSNRSAYRSMWHARDYANDYRHYARESRQAKKPADKATATEHAEGLGQNVDQAQKKLAQVRKQAGADKATLESLDKIDTLLKKAAKLHAEMDEMCMHEEVDSEGSMKCCDDAVAVLDEAIAEHEKLMKRLAGKTPPPKTE